MQCASIQRKGSTLQCTAPPVFGHTLCGRHIRARNPILWVDAHRDKSIHAICIQKWIRGWLIRVRLRRNGPGVLCRKNVANTEDLATFEDVTKQDPFSYFAFEENGKIWWFDYDTIYKWCLRNTEPTNPYTKVLLDLNTKKRIFFIWSYRVRHKLPVPEESSNYEERLVGRWNMLCQLFSCYGFGTIDPEHFRRFGKVQMHTIFRMILDDLPIVFRDDDMFSKRIRHCCIRGIETVHTTSTEIYVLQSVHKLLYITTIPRDPYVLLFTMLSAFYRL
jgi:hypothetical protein